MRKFRREVPSMQSSPTAPPAASRLLLRLSTGTLFPSFGSPSNLLPLHRVVPGPHGPATPAVLGAGPAPVSRRWAPVSGGGREPRVPRAPGQPSPRSFTARARPRGEAAASRAPRAPCTFCVTHVCHRSRPSWACGRQTLPLEAPLETGRLTSSRHLCPSLPAAYASSDMHPKS
ncbi:centrosomal protein of 170 kDa protein B-like isoform X2 [Camelus ferus]|uniref:Centrosomal protein of 170 kDa protein B-like isoform X2 n=1 Tax=Camelus ferus TaxID=419612 RepID=A0A8B8U1F1_CAMFR|nr:centrosomal protein of 170 kDa protein B-like isoform X2 [Camelus ferus]